MNIPYSNKKHFNNSYHHPQQQDENLLGMSYQTTSVHPMNFNNSFKQFKNEQQYGTPVSDSGSNFASSYSSNTSSSFSSASSLALSNLGSSFSSAHSTSTMGSPPNFYYGSSPNPHPINGSLNTSHTKPNIFTPTITSSNTNNDNNQTINTFSTPKSGATQTRPIVHSRPMSWDDVGEYARQSYSTSCNSGGLFVNELSSSMDDLTLASSPGLFGGSQFGSSLSTSSYANSFNESKIDNMTSSNPIDNMFVRSVVDKVLSDENNQDDQFHSNSLTTFKPRPTNQFHQRATSVDRYLHPQQAFKNTATPVNRRTLSQSCPTGMAQMNGVGYQLFQQQQTLSPNTTQQDDSAQLCRFYYSPEGCQVENCPFVHSNTTLIVPQTHNSHTRVQQQQQPQVKSKSSFTVINFGSSIPHSPSLPQQNPSSNGALPMASDNSCATNTPNSNNSNQTVQQVCQFFKKGECKFGDKCRNIHLKNKSKIDEQSRKKLKSIRCRFGVNCPFGHECYYYHTEADFEDTPSNNGNNTD
ncbi:makorin RING zinc-finger protein [Naegleria gruberi]|uniref:Makorin RING zinc-finger protein n=1 Tax=Naegleria gruberi TaxID=5762 RepID=D2VK96_NAEGR|nr:makorin RING zinc-finger protein [Naegleria gruberi]EFC42912.1 makorin RING zinc-finger protein [Naegleria gruberi]|eukprot:XP_002675656.1 makorin RING zinc-finger protein [Naegleria gruberi strain NEG-M]